MQCKKLKGIGENHIQEKKNLMNNLIKQNNIVLRNFLNITLLIIFSSCNNDSKEKTINSPSTKEDVSIDRQKLAERANDFYEKNKYSEAILSYDTLISIDSTKGGYYFKRAYCKSMLLNNDADAISDYYKAIERNYSKNKQHI